MFRYGNAENGYFLVSNYAEDKGGKRLGKRLDTDKYFMRHSALPSRMIKTRKMVERIYDGESSD